MEIACKYYGELKKTHNFSLTPFAVVYPLLLRFPIIYQGTLKSKREREREIERERAIFQLLDLEYFYNRPLNLLLSIDSNIYDQGKLY